MKVRKQNRELVVVQQSGGSCCGPVPEVKEQEQVAVQSACCGPVPVVEQEVGTPSFGGGCCG